MKCEKKTDGGATRIRGWHDFRPCENKAKYRVTYQSASLTITECVCGIHKRQLERFYKCKVEKL